MKKYKLENGKIIINKFAVQYENIINNPDSEVSQNVVQYVSSQNELNAVISELEKKNTEYKVVNLDVNDILKYEGIAVQSEETARRLIEPTLAEVKEDKIKEISNTCRETIFNGIDVELSSGNIKHFSLKTEDQINLNGLISRINIGSIKTEDSVPYHADGELCSLFSIADFTLIANKAADFISCQTTYCNHLMAFVRGLENRQEIENVFYGQKLTGEFLENYNRVTAGDFSEQNF